MTLQPTNTGPHIPVMLDEVLECLALRDGGAYVDGTFGAGGYSRAILDAADTTLWAIDRDPDAIERGQSLREQVGVQQELPSLHCWRHEEESAATASSSSSEAATPQVTCAAVLRVLPGPGKYVRPTKVE